MSGVLGVRRVGLFVWGEWGWRRGMGVQKVVTVVGVHIRGQNS